MPNGTIDCSRDYITAIHQDCQQLWPTLCTARSDATELRQLLTAQLKPYTSGDVDLVVFGSLARQEWTIGSDVDWTLLVDGQADSRHRVAAINVDRTLAEINFKGRPLPRPGAEGTFGSLAFSHDLVHHIGGQADTNRNTTQRILLLLEGTALRENSDEITGPCERITLQVLQRYLASDSNFHSEADNSSRIPRFLLNDIVRFWRTMCVDFAYKDWEQAGRKWALRNVKLRTSRKLLFVSGLFMVFSCFHNNELQRDGSTQADYQLRLLSHLISFVRSTPLDIIAWTLNETGATPLCVKLFDCYEAYLSRINDPNFREHLSTLDENNVYGNARFLECRDISHDLQDILEQLCFDRGTELGTFIAEYGVF